MVDEFNLTESDLAEITSETGTPAGWHPLIEGYDRSFSGTANAASIADDATMRLFDAVSGSASSKQLDASEIARLKDLLRSAFESGGVLAEDDHRVQILSLCTISIEVSLLDLLHELIIPAKIFVKT